MLESHGRYVPMDAIDWYWRTTPREQLPPHMVPNDCGSLLPPYRDAAKGRERAKLGARTFGWPRMVVFLTAAWCCMCFTAVVYSIPHLRGAADLVLLYFQPLLPVAFMLWLWAHNVQRFQSVGIEYEMCFSSRDKRYLLPHSELYQLALVLTAMVLTAAAGYSLLNLAAMVTAASYLPLTLYFAVAMLIMAPINALCMHSRLFFSETLQRVLMPFQEVTWSDFLLADIFTSLSKSSSDLAKAACGLVAGPNLLLLRIANGTSIGDVCSPLARPVLVALCLPYIIRFIQCIIVYRTTGNRGQIFNAIKYSSAFPSLLLTAFEHEYHVTGRRYPYYNAWLVAMFANSLYSFYWDVEMDWDMPWLVQPGSTHVGPLRLPALKPDAFYSRAWYAWLLISNLVLRLTWTHRLLGNLENYATVAMAMALLEAFRRYQWTYVRVETEIRKLRLKHTHEHLDDAGESER